MYNSTLIERFKETRAHSLELCENIHSEDMCLQVAPFVSPTKWHLAHTTWFFEELVLKQFKKNYQRYNEDFPFYFNSYYKSAGEHCPQSQRGEISTPTPEEIYCYRDHVDCEVLLFLKDQNLSQSAEEQSKLYKILEIGINHEQQHQELILMDIKYTLFSNKNFISYGFKNEPAKLSKKENEYKEEVFKVGHSKSSFHFDNEFPAHKTYLQSFSISEDYVTNREYLNFINDNGYKNHKLWLSLGYDWVNENKITSPLYWLNDKDQWHEFTLNGLKPLDLDKPVSHISYFEADAFSKWSEARLPTEFEAEKFLSSSNQPQGYLWNWTQSHYSPYPGYREFNGMLSEYNGKFMCNQFVLKGGCFATPKGHYRHTYRNFYKPSDRWMFSGIRLAKDLK